MIRIVSHSSRPALCPRCNEHLYRHLTYCLTYAMAVAHESTFASVRTTSRLHAQLALISSCSRVQLAFLFSIGIGLVIIAICRLPIYGRGTSQVNRNTLGSIEGFFAAFVANVPTLVTLRRPNDKNTTLASHTFGTSSRSRGDGSGGRSRREKFRRIGDDRVGTGSGSAGVVTKASVETMKTMDDGILVTRDIEMTRTEKKKETGYPKYLPPGVGSDEELVRETYSGR
jgi:hypothetical protein